MLGVQHTPYGAGCRLAVLGGADNGARVCLLRRRPKTCSHSDWPTHLRVERVEQLLSVIVVVLERQCANAAERVLELAVPGIINRCGRVGEADGGCPVFFVEPVGLISEGAGHPEHRARLRWFPYRRGQAVVGRGRSTGQSRRGAACAHGELGERGACHVKPGSFSNMPTPCMGCGSAGLALHRGTKPHTHMGGEQVDEPRRARGTAGGCTPSGSAASEVAVQICSTAAWVRTHRQHGWHAAQLCCGTATVLDVSTQHHSTTVQDLVHCKLTTDTSLCCC